MVYIGQTIRSISTRLVEHKSKKTHLGRAIRKYGFDNFSVECLHEVDTLAQLNDLEANYVTEQFIDSSNTYNYRVGGGNSGQMSSTTKQKISKARTGTTMSDETKQKISEYQQKNPPSQVMREKMSHKGCDNGCFGRTGEQHPMFGKIRPEHSEFMKQYSKDHPRTITNDTREKLRNAQKGKRMVHNIDGTRNFISGAMFNELIKSGILTKRDGKYYRGGDLS